MNSYVVECLKKGIENNCGTDKTILKAYLKDLLVDYPIECKLLITAIDENTISMIQSDMENGMIVTVDKYTYHLSSMRGMKESIARDVVECFFEALNIEEQGKAFHAKNEKKLKSVLPKKRNQLIALLIAVFYGYIGMDRIYLGYYGIGILKLFTCGFLYVGWIVDIIKIFRGTLIPAKSSGYKTGLRVDKNEN